MGFVGLFDGCVLCILIFGKIEVGLNIHGWACVLVHTNCVSICEHDLACVNDTYIWQQWAVEVFILETRDKYSSQSFKRVLFETLIYAL